MISANCCCHGDTYFSGDVSMSRWQAPEILAGGGLAPVLESKEADVFAFGMVAAEVFTGSIPFDGEIDPKTSSLVLNGRRPEMPRNPEKIRLTDKMWKFVERCWKQNPRERPMIQEVVEQWQGFVGDPVMGDDE